MHKLKKMHLKLIIPHILYVKWDIEDNYMKEFIEDFGYWSWKKSSPTLKIYINDATIIGEQYSFFLPLDEEDCQCIFFAPYNNKTYRIEYGRILERNIFIPCISSNGIEILKENDYHVFRLPDSFIFNQ